MLQFMGSQVAGHDRVTELNQTELSLMKEHRKQNMHQPCFLVNTDELPRSQRAISKTHVVTT